MSNENTYVPKPNKPVIILDASKYPELTKLVERYGLDDGVRRYRDGQSAHDLAELV